MKGSDGRTRSCNEMFVENKGMNQFDESSEKSENSDDSEKDLLEDVLEDVLEDALEDVLEDAFLPAFLVDFKLFALLFVVCPDSSLSANDLSSIASIASFPDSF